MCLLDKKKSLSHGLHIICSLFLLYWSCHFVVFRSDLHYVKYVETPLHKKWSFPLRISSVNVTKSAANCGFGHIYWRNPQWKTSFFVQCTGFLWCVLSRLRFYSYTGKYRYFSVHIRKSLDQKNPAFWYILRSDNTAQKNKVFR